MSKTGIGLFWRKVMQGGDIECYLGERNLAEYSEDSILMPIKFDGSGSGVGRALSFYVTWTRGH